MKTKKIKTLYKFWAWMYHPFIKVWNFSLARNAEKDIEKFMQKNFDDEIDVLDLACGTGINIDRILKQNIKINSYTGVDLSSHMQKRAKKRAKPIKNKKFLIKDVFKYKPAKKFDLIICTWLLSHLENPSKLVKKYQKYLKKGGYALYLFQGEAKDKKTLTKIANKVENVFQANLIPEKELNKFPKKAFLSKSYVGGYVRLMVFKG